MHAEFHSYRPYLQAACRTVRPWTFLEWGPGDSTQLVIEESPGVRVLTIEHDSGWYAKCRERFAKWPEVEVVLVPHSLRPGEAGGYVTYPLRQRLLGQEPTRYDLVFVDGRSRCDCLVVAYTVLADGGLVVLHDADRPAYQPGWMLYPHVCLGPRDGTVVVAKQPDLVERYRTAFQVLLEP